MQKLHQHFNRAPNGESHDHAFINANGYTVEYTHTHLDTIIHANPPIAHPHPERDEQPDAKLDADVYDIAYAIDDAG